MKYIFLFIFIALTSTYIYTQDNILVIKAIAPTHTQLQTNNNDTDQPLFPLIKGDEVELNNTITSEREIELTFGINIRLYAVGKTELTVNSGKTENKDYAITLKNGSVRIRSRRNTKTPAVIFVQLERTTIKVESADVIIVKNNESVNVTCISGSIYIQVHRKNETPENLITINANETCAFTLRQQGVISAKIDTISNELIKKYIADFRFSTDIESTAIQQKGLNHSTIYAP